ncbi:hypothetical protein Ahy_B01g053101 isoform A [Arachis hypogaea]|uniref:SWIM-type domain-containing protein n=1 Tax=Arachis hypogaea TaxID=3818 RepID=A0A445AR18_ARAHY|nr:hypothetical protein Ahy_B01g053101 isoform A [Arachis hypogaea]
MWVLNTKKGDDDCSKYVTIEFCQEGMIFMYSSLRMDSFEIPCEHIVKVLVHIDICDISQSLIKEVKSTLHEPSGFTRDAVVISHQSVLMDYKLQKSLKRHVTLLWGCAHLTRLQMKPVNNLSEVWLN